MKYYLVKKVDKEYKIIKIMHNRKELLYTIRDYHGFMYYCTNGAYNYNNKALIEIFNDIENKPINQYIINKSQVFITRENKYINNYCIDNEIMEV